MKTMSRRRRRGTACRSGRRITTIPQTTTPVKRSRYAKSINSARRKRKEKAKAEVTETEANVSDKRTPIYSGFDDTADENGDYAEDEDYGFGADADSDMDSKKFSEEDAYFPPSFREYVLSLFASLFLRVRARHAATPPRR